MTPNVSVRKLFKFSPETGRLFWEVKPSIGTKRGSEAGWLSEQGYICIRIAGRNYRAHRLIWLYVTGNWPYGEIDHINGVRSDNRFENLRDVSHAINQQNRTAPGRSGKLLGTYQRKSGNWSARIAMSGEMVSLGTFKTELEAHAKYLIVKRQIHPGCTI
jgi:hypothetical protein